MNLKTRYMGLELRSPIVVSACPLSETASNIAAMEDAGAGAVVLYSLFEEQIRRENEQIRQVAQSTTNTFAEAADFFPEMELFEAGGAQYLELIRQAKQRVSMPVIASLNGVSVEGWIDYARQIEQAGADALELNVYYIPADPAITSTEVEQRYLRIVRIVKNTVSIPVAIKLSPYFSAMGHMAERIAGIGADALVLFNRFYQPDFDIEELKVISDLKLSAATEIRLPLLWIAALYGRIDASLAATSGVESAREVVKYLLAGADVVMTASALLRHGVGHLETMNRDLADWMQRKDFESVEAFRGALSQRHVKDTTAFERANYLQILRGSGNRSDPAA